MQNYFEDFNFLFYLFFFFSYDLITIYMDCFLSTLSIKLISKFTNLKHLNFFLKILLRTFFYYYI